MSWSDEIYRAAMLKAHEATLAGQGPMDIVGTSVKVYLPALPDSGAGAGADA